MRCGVQRTSLIGLAMRPIYTNLQVSSTIVSGCTEAELSRAAVGIPGSAYPIAYMGVVTKRHGC
jgi:hypothetical protein